LNLAGADDCRGELPRSFQRFRGYRNWWEGLETLGYVV
jgi:hypothetical protein